MKRIAILIVIIISSSKANCQFAIVQDKDGYANVRQEQSTNSKIIGKIKTDEIISADAANDDLKDVWFSTIYTIPKIDVDTLKDHIIGDKPDSDSIWVVGYVHRSRLQFICDMPEIKGHYQLSRNALVFDNGSISLKILLEKFEPSAHKITLDSGGFVILIDGMEPFGVDGELPRINAKSIQLTINGLTVKIPKKLYKNFYEMSLENVRLRKFNKDLYFEMPMNSDGAGSWGAVWVIRNGKIIKIFSERLC